LVRGVLVEGNSVGVGDAQDQNEAGGSEHNLAHRIFLLHNNMINDICI